MFGQGAGQAGAAICGPQGCRDLLVYCNSGRCNHSTIMNVGHLPDETRVNSLGDGIVCVLFSLFWSDAMVFAVNSRTASAP